MSAGDAREPSPSPGEPGVRVLRKLVARSDLTVTEAGEVVRGLMEGRYPPPLAGAILTALAAKGESVDELYGFASVMREMATPFRPPGAEEAIDLCGTGGAATPTFNVSTVASFVVAAAGVPVVKHGNSSSRGPCGSSDLIEALGLPVKTSPAFAEESFRREGIAFLHAPLFHPLTRAVAPLRRALGIRTVFNQLGPLTNPAGVRRQLVGAYSIEYGRKALDVLTRLGCTSVVVAASDDGADELSPVMPTRLIRHDDHGTTLERVDPEDLLSPEEREHGWGPMPPPEAAAAALALLSGKDPSARTGAVILTSGVALWMAGMAGDIEGGTDAARGLIGSGAAHSKLESLRALARDREWGA